MKTLFAIAACIAAFVVPVNAADQTDEGAAGLLLYAKYCDGSELKPEALQFAKIWKTTHPVEVQARITNTLDRMKSAFKTDKVEEVMVLWCAIVKDKLPSDLKN